MKTLKIKVNTSEDRNDLVNLFAIQGYKTWVVFEKNYPFGDKVYVCSQVDDKCVIEQTSKTTM